MKSSKRPAAAKSHTWWYAAAFLTAAFLVYGPALNGPFVYDDRYLPFFSPAYGELPFSHWIGVRPLLMISFWINYELSGLDPASYHAVNILLHGLNSLLIWLCVGLLLDRAGANRKPAWIAAGIFLVHPVQTESVAYVASRSETLSIFLFLSAYWVFLRAAAAPVSWKRTLAIVTLFGAAVSTKEHTAVLPGLLLLTDLYWHGVKRNWRLYCGLLAGAAAAGAAIVMVLKYADTAGFGLKDLSWSEYLFTQARVLCKYLRLYLFPVGLNLDPDVKVSRSILEHGSWLGALVLIGLAALAWRYRREFPLASFGYFAFLLLIAPTSSVLPIRDVMAERRLYLPFLGLVLITVDFVRRYRVSAAAPGLVLAALAVLTFQRSQLWADPISLWRDTAQKSPRLLRPQFHYAFALMQAGRCDEAVAAYEAAAKLDGRDASLLVDWALALDCVGRPVQALERLREAAARGETAHLYSLIGMIHGKSGRSADALQALDRAQKLDPSYAMTYFYRGNVLATAGNWEGAAAEYSRVLELEPHHQHAAQALFSAKQQLGQRK